MIAALAALTNTASAKEMYAVWGCPTAEGPIAIATAFRDGTNEDIGIAAESNNCAPFPYAIQIEPVKFIVETEDANDFVYVWEVRPVDSELTFFTNLDSAGHAAMMETLKGPGL